MELNKLVQTSYKESYTYDSLLALHKFFSIYENIFEVFYAIRSFITNSSYKLEEGQKEIFLIIVFPGKEIKMSIREKPKIVDEMIITIANDLFELKEKFLNKLTELEEINQSFSEIKKQNKQLIQQNKQLNENNEKIIKENKELNELIKNLKETRIEILNTKLETILLYNNLMTDEDRNTLIKFKEKLTGNFLLNENIIAFDNVCKAYLFNWLSNGDNNKTIKTVLLYKGSRDGDKYSNFHQKCDEKGATLTLVKSTAGYHFGGFTTTPWKSSGGYVGNSYSFLFSLDKKLKYPMKGTSSSVYHGNYGPVFGGSDDLCICDGCMNNENSYSNTGSYDITDSFSGSKYFKVNEIEVYQVIFE